MNKSVINPWQWQDNLGFSQAVEVSNVTGTLYCAGQAAMSADGKPAGGDMKEQIRYCCQNLQEVIALAGYSAGNIIRLNIYTTSVPLFFEAYGELMAWMQQAGCVPSSTLVGVEALAFPELMVELEATVIK